MYCKLWSRIWTAVSKRLIDGHQVKTWIKTLSIVNLSFDVNVQALFFLIDTHPLTNKAENERNQNYKN